MWRGAVVEGGYGVFTWNNRTVAAHCASYEIFVGPIPAGLLIRHSCDNRPCVQPSHLSTGTHLDNARDAVVRQRQQHKLSVQQVLAIRAEHATGEYFLRELAERYGVSIGEIWHIVKRKHWTHI